MLLRLKEKYPEAALCLLLFERNREVLEILDPVPEKGVFTVEDRSLRAFTTSAFRVIRRLRRMQIDTVIDGELFSRASSLFSLLSGARVRVGFEPHTQEGLYRGGFINRPVLYTPYRHFSSQLVAMVDAIELEGRPLVKRVLQTPALGSLPTLDPGERGRFHERVGRDFPTLGKRVLVLVSPGGGLLPVRAWPISHFCELVRGLSERGLAVGVIGTEEDRPLAGALRAQCGSCLDFTGYTRSIKELVFLLQRSALLVANDGGPSHFASIAATPTIVLFGPETPLLYRPLGKNIHPVHTPLACSPCLTAYNHRKTPCDGDNLCLKLISPAIILEKACALIRGGSDTHLHAVTG